ncbi:MAG: PAS domain S-box protein [Limisphaerales bacterium]
MKLPTKHLVYACSPAGLLVVLTVSIFVAEVIVMFLMAALPEMPTLLAALFDAALLTLLVFPAVRAFAFVPLIRQLQAREAAEAQLQETNRTLEQRVQERTHELQRANEALRGEITERGRAEAALREGEESHLFLFENMMNGFAYCELLFEQGRPQDFIYLSVNRAFETLTGLKNVVGKKVSEVIPGLRENDPELFEIYGRVALTGEAEHFEMYVAALKMWFTITVYSPKRNHFIAMFDVITERKQAEARLHLQSAALAAAANEVVITDREGIIQWVNPAFTKTTGYTLEEAVGQNPRILKSGEHDNAFYQNLWATILHGEVWHGEIVNRRKDGSLYTEDTVITPVKDEHGETTHFVAIKQDITEKKLLEAKFLRAQRLEGLGALAGGVAHDLNNVLAPILMASELLKTQATDPRTRDLLGMIEGNSQRGAGMIRQILAFARGTAGDKVSMQVKHLIKDISRMMKDTFPPNIRTELHVDEKLSLVQGEPTELYQVLLNLCVNARDAMPNGGTITVTAANVLLDETYAHLSHEAPPGHYVVLTVADTGCGIPPEIQAKVFDAFFTTKEPGKGTGLGLATVKDIVTGHGGFIHLYSEVGVGTQLKIYLPAVGGEEAAGDTIFLKLPTGHGELILVVDDEAAVREIVKATLEANGYRVVLADDGTQAVARFVEHLKDVELLLTDIQMPHMDGMATIRALRNIRADLRVIAASGLTAHEQALKVTGLNVQGFIAKPFTAASLLQALDGALHPK